MDDVEIERGNRGSVEHGAHAPDNDEFNAMPGQDSQDFQKLRTRTFHGV